MVALSRKREVFSWGYGAEGQGGHGSLLHMRMPRRVSSLQEVSVAQVCVCARARFCVCAGFLVAVASTAPTG